MSNRTTIPLVIVAIAVAASAGYVVGTKLAPRGLPLLGGTALTVASSKPGETPAPPVARPSTSPSPSPRDPNLSDFRAPALTRPLVNFDPGLASRGPRPSLRELYNYQYGNPAVFFAPTTNFDPLDWRLSRPDQGAVRGYGGVISLAPGQVLPLHLSGSDHVARLDVFRMGLQDARNLLTVPNVQFTSQPEAIPDQTNGLIVEHWPVSYKLKIPKTWRSGVYLIKMTGSSGGQSYIIFVVRATAPTRLMVVLPTMTYQAYNDYGGADLYGWDGGPSPRAYAVSFDRPFNHQYGAGLFFRLDFPLIVWLEDHGYAPSYITDVDLDHDPALIAGARTLVFSGHGEYWTGAMRDTINQASRSGLNLVFFGSNQAFWQVRLVPNAEGRPDRIIVCYKSPTLDPITANDPGATTTRFQDPPVLLPPKNLMGLEYGGIVGGIQPMVVGSGITTFAPDIGLRVGQQMPGLVADEIDQVPKGFNGVLLGATPILVREHPGMVIASAALWINPAGGRVFDAGTFDFSWGLDPRYSAALPGFPAQAYSQLTARILAWAGAQPSL